MWSLISEKDKRVYNIIELLFNSKSPLTSHYLAEMTQASVRAVKNDLNEIREEIKQLDGQLHSSSEGFNLNFPSHVSLDVFQHQLY